jgi:hypothetical protein
MVKRPSMPTGIRAVDAWIASRTFLFIPLRGFSVLP